MNQLLRIYCYFNDRIFKQLKVNTVLQILQVANSTSKEFDALVLSFTRNKRNFFVLCADLKIICFVIIL